MKDLQKIYAKINPEIINEGKNWYRTANEFCRELSIQFGHPVEKIAGILSALSPGTNWNQNKRDCIALLKGINHKFQTYGQNVGKARLILKSDSNPLDFFSIKTASKTRNFYLNILLDQTAVTIDRHAYRVATGLEYTSLTPKQYEVIAGHYRKFASKVGLIPFELQAVLWVNYRVENEIQLRKDVPF